MSWQWAEPSQFIRWFSDGERRYGKALWALASGWLTKEAVSRQDGHLKVAARGTRSGNQDQRLPRQSTGRVAQG